MVSWGCVVPGGLLSADDMVLVAEDGAELGQKLHARIVERNEKGVWGLM